MKFSNYPKRDAVTNSNGCKINCTRFKVLSSIQRWRFASANTTCYLTGSYFPLPNEIFMLELTSGEIAVYSYLLFLEDRKTFQCYPSYKNIGKAVKMSKNTVRKYVADLESKKLIRVER